MSVSDHGHGVADSSASASPLSPHFAGGLPHVPSPPPGAAAGGVRRHQSLNYPQGNSGVRRLASGLKRAGTLQVGAKGAPGGPYAGPQSPSPTNADEEYDDESARAEEDSYFQQTGQYPGSPIGRSSPWSTPGGEWRAQVGGNTAYNNGGIDDVSRALSALEIGQQYGNVQQGQSVHPPRFNPSHPPPVQAPGMRGGNGNGNGSRKLQLVTDVDGRNNQGVQSASAYVPPIGHGQPGQQANRDEQQGQQQGHPHSRDRAFTASGGAPWDNKERLLVGRASNPSLQQLYQQGKLAENNGQNIPSVPSIPAQYLNQAQAPRLGASGAVASLANQGAQGVNQGQGNQNAGVDTFLGSPIDVPTLIATKGYNPVDFDTRPAFVSNLRHYVIRRD